MNWTTTPPTEPGWYWRRLRTNATAHILKLYWNIHRDTLVDFGDAFVRADCMPEGEWWPEPIKVPE